MERIGADIYAPILFSHVKKVTNVYKISCPKICPKKLALPKKNGQKLIFLDFVNNLFIILPKKMGRENFFGQAKTPDK